jgi:OmpA-OmpF porin, OOP family
MSNKGFMAVVLSVIMLASCASGVKYSEYSPTISPDGKMMIYQSEGLGDGVFRLHVRFKTPLGWSQPMYLLFANMELNTGAPFITYDQNHLLLSSNQQGGVGGVDIWMAERQKLVWGKPVNIGRPINSEGYDGFASLSPDGNTMYFVREFDNKIDPKDDKFCIYTSVKKEGAWTEPVMMPAPINSRYSDFAPVILADGKTLIFSSTRPGGYGGYDLYKTEMMSNGRWSEPVNLGPTINTKFHDWVASIPASGDVIYQAKPADKDGSVYRIKSTPIPDSLRQSSVVTVAGSVLRKGRPDVPVSATITITDVDNGDIQTIETNRSDGKYHIVLNKGRLYDVSVTGRGYTFYSSTFDIRKSDKFSAIMRDIELELLEPGAKITLNNLYFKFNSAEILPESVLELNRVIRVLKANPGMMIEIAGHTDSTGAKDYNDRLSTKRAHAVNTYLVNNGIEKKRMIIKGYGFNRPAVSPENRDLVAKNRRVEIEILSI